MTFPPPNPDQQIVPSPTSASGGSPRRTASIVALTSGLLVGGVLVGSQFVSANTPSVADEPTTSSTDVPDTEAPADDTTESGQHEDGGQEPGWMEFDSLFELDPEVTAQFEEFDACISEQLGDLDLLGGFDVIGDVATSSFEEFDFDFPEGFEPPPGVFVEAGDDTGFYEFGDGDGTITITKSGDEISVESDGDVNVQTFELPDFGPDGDFSFPELTPEQQAEFDAKTAEIDAAWEAADSACGDLLPDIIGGMLDGAFDGGVFSGGPFEIPADD